MAKKQRMQTPSTHATVVTHGGTTILPLERRVWVAVGEQAARKLVRDLKPGDLVLERNTRASVSLEQIHEALLQHNLLYQQAHRSLYFQPETGGARPRLQEFLFRAMKNRYGLNNLDSSEAEMAQARKTIAARLSKAEKIAARLFAGTKTARLERAEQTVGNWLAGETVLPSNPEALLLLRNIDRENFDNLFGKREETRPSKIRTLQETPLLWAHRHWQTVHAALTSWVSGFSQKPPSRTKEFEVPEESDLPAKPPEAAKKGISLAEERRLVYDTLLQPIQQKVSTEFSFMRVKEVQPISSTHATPKEGGAAAPKLSKGIVIAEKGAELSAIRARATNFKAIKRQQLILGHFVERILDTYHLTRGTKPSVSGFGPILLGFLANIDEIRSTPGKAIRAIVKTEATGDQIVSFDFRVPEVESLLATLLSQMRDGVLDEKHGLEKGTALKLFERHAMLSKSIPVEREYNKMQQLKQHSLSKLHDATEKGKVLAQSDKDDINQQIAQLARRVNEYGISPGGIPWPESDKFATIAELGAYKARVRQGMKNAGFSYHEPGEPPTEVEVREILEKLGCKHDTTETLLDLFGRRNFLK